MSESIITISIDSGDGEPETIGVSFEDEAEMNRFKPAFTTRLLALLANMAVGGWDAFDTN